MAAEDRESERCIAITGSGNRCKRVAKDEGFCFQHDSSSDTVEVERAEKAGVVNWLSSELEARSATASDVRRDVYLNIADMQGGLQDTIDDFRAGNTSFSTLVDRFQETALEVGGDRSQDTATGAVVGGIVGSPLGPVGIYAGMVAGSSIGFFTSQKDPRTVIGLPVTEVPDDAEVVPSDHKAIVNITPIQLVIKTAIQDEDEDWIRETNTRTWDMDAVGEALSDIPRYETEEAPPNGHYIQDSETDRIAVVIFGESDADFPIE